MESGSIDSGVRLLLLSTMILKSSMLFVSVVYSFLLLSSIPLYEYNAICLSIHLLMNIWIVSCDWLL